MTRNKIERAGIALPLFAVLVASTLAGCSVGAADDSTSEQELAEVPEEFRRGHRHDGDHGDRFFDHHLFCGGPEERECRDGNVCIPFVPRGCPGPRRLGMCVPEPHHCPDVDRPVCGCDGNTYKNYCEAARAGVSVEHKGACDPSGEPVCGDEAGTECAGAGVCTDGLCVCKTIEKCSGGMQWNSDPTVCGCEPVPEDPCRALTCEKPLVCVVADDGTASCETPSR